MHTANYLSTHTAQGQAGRYPLSLQTLDFIQQQILALQSSISTLVGQRYCILLSPTVTEYGLVLIEGELLPIAPTMLLASLETGRLISSERDKTYLYIQERHEDITADGTTYRSARTQRIAYVGRSQGAVGSTQQQRRYPIESFAYGGRLAEALQAQLTLELKVVRGELYIRHGQLPPNAQITLRRYKGRGSKRGARSRSPIRDARKAYVHWRHIQLERGTPGEWYRPRVAYEDISSEVYSQATHYVGKSVLETCHQLALGGHPRYISSTHSYTLEQGLRGVELMTELGLCLVLDQHKDDHYDTEADAWGGSKRAERLVVRACKSKHQSIYAKLALQVVLYDGTTHPDRYGPIYPIRYRVQKVATAKATQAFRRSITLDL